MKIRICPAVKAVKQSNESLFLENLLSGEVVQEVIIAYSFDFPHKNAYARGFDLEGGFPVLKGSWASKGESSKLSIHYKRLRKRLVDGGILEVKQYCLEFIKPYLFKNEYEATCVIGANEKYRKHSGVWQDQLGRTPLENRLIGTTEL